MKIALMPAHNWPFFLLHTLNWMQIWCNDTFNMLVRDKTDEEKGKREVNIIGVLAAPGDQ